MNKILLPVDGSKRSLRTLRAPAYILAHKAVVTDLSALIDSNIAFLLQKSAEMLDCLTDGMTFADWIYTFCRREQVRTKNELKFSVVERNFDNFVDWLVDTGRVEVRREFCAKHYYRVG